MTRRISIGACLFILSLPLLNAACGTDKATEPFKDAPRGETNDNAADLITMPDGFSNVAAKCDGTTRVYVVFHQDAAYGSVAVSPNHPLCGGQG